jgi:hypothetical protein
MASLISAEGAAGLKSRNLHNGKPTFPTRFPAFDFRYEYPGMRISVNSRDCVRGRWKPQKERFSALDARTCAATSHTTAECSKPHRGRNHSHIRDGSTGGDSATKSSRERSVAANVQSRLHVT